MSQSEPPLERVKAKRLLSIGAGAVVVHEDKVLLVRSIYGVTKGRYLLPAGRVNVGETPDAAAVRETLEETNLHVEIEGLLGVRLWIMASEENNYFFMFRAKLLSPIHDLRPHLEEVDDARFFSRAELAALDEHNTWLGLIATAFKGLDANAVLWPNHADLQDTSVDMPDHWRMWM